MEIVRTRRELLQYITSKKGGAFLVPTMGYLHEGHLSLVRMARKDAAKNGSVVASIFVNPAQFNDPKDLEAYPRDETRDVSLLKRAGSDVAFIPPISEIYPAVDLAERTTVRAGKVANRWEGAHRPGHFDGVATVVAKLFNIVMPDVAYFGEKDWQQCKVIEQMVRDLDFPLELRFGKTVREADGLAMSSRNALLRPEMRVRAASLFRILCDAAKAFKEGAEPRRIEDGTKFALSSAGFSSVDYVAVVDEESLEPAERMLDARILAAATIGGVRLIDNVRV